MAIAVSNTTIPAPENQHHNQVPREHGNVAIVVEFEHPIGFRFVELVDYLENLLGRKVDVLTPAGIQNIRIERVARNITQSIVYV